MESRKADRWRTCRHARTRQARLLPRNERFEWSGAPAGRRVDDRPLPVCPCAATGSARSVPARARRPRWRLRVTATARRPYPTQPREETNTGPRLVRPGDARASRRARHGRARPPMFSAESARAVRGSSGAGRRPTWWRRASLYHSPDRLGNRPGRAVCANMEGNMGAFD